MEKPEEATSNGIMVIEKWLEIAMRKSRMTLAKISNFFPEAV